MNAKYQIEIDEFREQFKTDKHKKMVLYGIGRYTATLVEGLHDYQIVGLMDKEPQNIGKILFGLPILDMETAEKLADMVVINTSETYWNVIYNRISGMNIPVFYKNGKKAENMDRHKSTDFWNERNENSLGLLMEQSEVLSFDFFDTLFMRSVCNPRDVLRLLEQEIQDIWLAEKGLIEVREEAIKESSEYYSFDELYFNIEKISGLPHSVIREIREKEILLEKKLLFPRTELLELLKEALGTGKEVYIISDMYLPKVFYIEVCRQYGIDLPEDNLLLSNALRRSKADGSLWDYYTETMAGGRKALHVGDHRQADLEEPQKYGIETYRTPGPWELMSMSTLGEIASHVCTNFDSAVIGCILKKMFANPDRWYNSQGTVRIDNHEEMGYVVFGPVILTFLLWLDRQRRQDQVNNLVFMSRDGYFLKEDYEYLCELTGQQPDCCYLGISRQLAMSASITTKEELLEYARMPYSGSITELFEDRFKIKDIKEMPGQSMEHYLEEYEEEIRQRLSDIRNNYLRYLSRLSLDENSAVADLGFYGNNQRYLNKLTKGSLRGYYFNANLSEQNENTKVQQMKACFQRDGDLTGKESQVLKRMIFIESVLTAPYGMVEAVDEDGAFVCSDKKQNQLYFQEKEEINRGVKTFIYDYISLFGYDNLRINREFTDWYYGYCMNGALEFDDHVKQSFYNDNAMMNRIESTLFY